MDPALDDEFLPESTFEAARRSGPADAHDMHAAAPAVPSGGNPARRRDYVIVGMVVAVAAAATWMVGGHLRRGSSVVPRPAPVTTPGSVTSSTREPSATGTQPAATGTPQAATIGTSQPAPAPDVDVPPATTMPAAATAPREPAPRPAPVRSAAPGVGGILSGWWTVTNRIEASVDRPAEDLNLGYRILLTQSGNDVTGVGYRWMENGRPLTGSERTAVAVSGRVDGPTLTLQFTERDTSGESADMYSYELTDAGVWQGQFNSGLAQVHGTSQARRMPSPE